MGPAPVVQGLTRRTKRNSIGSDFESHAALEAAKQAREVEELIALMPPAVAHALLGGAPGAQQVSDPEDRAKTLYDAVALKAGSDGSSLSNARRAWLAFLEYATSLELPDSGLPAKPALVAPASCVRRLHEPPPAQEPRAAPRLRILAAWASCGYTDRKSVV